MPAMHTINYHRALTSQRSQGLSGSMQVPGDKSLSHRAVIFASLAIGQTRIKGLLLGDDVLRTIAAFRMMGVKLEQQGEDWIVDGVGLCGLCAPGGVLDMGNSGTAARLLMGLLAAFPFQTTFIGDASLSARPMGRVTKPLRQMGALITSRKEEDKEKLPITLQGYSTMIPLEYRSPVASAQLKSALLLAGMNISGRTTVIEPVATRDHTENMLGFLGVPLKREDKEDGKHISIQGHEQFYAKDMDIPGDPSSAAFPIVAALITPGSRIELPNVCINPLRTGLFRTLFEMGARIQVQNQREQCGEMVADLVVEHSQLKGVTVPERRVPSMIDEFPIFSIAAAFAIGTTTMTGLEELRVKESDRLAAITEGLKQCGVACEEGEDRLIVYSKGVMQGGVTIKTHHDHRIAMSFLIAGLQAESPIAVDTGEMILTSFPGFVELMQSLGAVIE